VRQSWSGGEEDPVAGLAVVDEGGVAVVDHGRLVGDSRDLGGLGAQGFRGADGHPPALYEDQIAVLPRGWLEAVVSARPLIR
jgi:hypothetical protein